MHHKLLEYKSPEGISYSHTHDLLPLPHSHTHTHAHPARDGSPDLPVLLRLQPR